MIDLFNAVFQTMHGKTDTISSKSRRIDDIAACLDVGSLKGLDHIFVRKHPFFGADALGHACCHQIGTGSSVQENNVLCKCLKILFCHLIFPPWNCDTDKIVIAPRPHPGNYNVLQKIFKILHIITLFCLIFQLPAYKIGYAFKRKLKELKDE